MGVAASTLRKFFRRQGYSRHHPDAKWLARRTDGDDHSPQARTHTNHKHHSQDQGGKCHANLQQALA